MEIEVHASFDRFALRDLVERSRFVCEVAVAVREDARATCAMARELRSQASARRIETLDELAHRAASPLWTG